MGSQAPHFGWPKNKSGDQPSLQIVVDETCELHLLNYDFGIELILIMPLDFAEVGRSWILNSSELTRALDMPRIQDWNRLEGSET